MIQIPEKDWKIIRSMKDRNLNQACTTILDKIKYIIQNKNKEAHARYLELWKTIKYEDKNIGVMFDDLKRSNALFKLVEWRKNELVSSDAMKLFTKETRQRVEALINW